MLANPIVLTTAVIAEWVFASFFPTRATRRTRNAGLHSHGQLANPKVDNGKKAQQHRLNLTCERTTAMTDNDFNRYSEALLVQYNLGPHWTVPTGGRKTGSLPPCKTPKGETKTVVK